jgi:hypothetical protein
MLAYRHYDPANNEEEAEKKATYEVIENFVKKESKSHRSVMDCETGYLTKVWRESQHLPNENVSSGEAMIDTNGEIR